MQSKIVEKEVEKNVEYPCLMKSTEEDIVVLFTEKDKGTLLCKTAIYNAGEYSTDWDMEQFHPFNGSITLSND